MERLKKKPATKVLSLRVPIDYYDKFKKEIEFIGSNNSEELWHRISQGGLSNDDFIKSGKFIQRFREHKPELDKILMSLDSSDESKVALQELLNLHTEHDQYLKAFEGFASTKLLKFFIGLMRVELGEVEI